MMHGSGNFLAEKSIIFPFMVCKMLVSLLLASYSLGLDVGHKTGAVVNNSGTAVEMCWRRVEKIARVDAEG